MPVEFDDYLLCHRCGQWYPSLLMWAHPTLPGVANEMCERCYALEFPDEHETHKPVDMVNRPAHYTVGGIETIDFIEAKKLGYHLANAVKYISRAEHKGKFEEDISKAIWYLQRVLEYRKSI